MSIINAMQKLRASARKWLPGGRRVARVGRGLAAFLLLAVPLAHAEFNNGGFEQDWAGWEAPVRMGRPGTDMAPFPPTTTDDLGLSLRSDGSVSAVVGTLSDTNTSSTLKTPLFGNKSARVGDAQTGRRGASVRQTATMGVGDIDPADGKVHIRFAIAPVLSDGGHPGPRQPFFFVEVKNKTKGTQLFRTFNFAGETGVPWQGGVGDYKFTNWQAIDIGPGAGVLDVGDEVEVIISTAGCADGGHAGYVYVDSGQGLTTLPGPFVTATGPEYAVRSDVGADTPSMAPPAGQRTITYNYHYSNGGDAPMVNSQVVISSPQDQQTKTGNTVTKYQQNLRVDPTSLPPSGCSITSFPQPTPTNTRVDKSLGTIDVVICDVGTLNPGNAGDLQLRWIVPSDAKEPTVNHGNYYIQSASTPPLLGPLVRTNLTNLVLADLKSTVTNPSSSLTCGSSTTYTVTLENNGPGNVPVGVQISNAVPAGLTVTGWNCTATGGTLACPTTNGVGSIAGTVSTVWPVGEKLEYTINANVDACPGGSRLITYPVGLTLPANPTTVDPDSSNNTSANEMSAGLALQLLDVATAGAGLGKVTSVLPGIVCDKTTATQCSDSKQFPQGSQVALYANAPAGSIFAGWSGGGCSGTAQPCTVTMDQARSVMATFATPVEVEVILTGGGGTITPPTGTKTPVAPGETTSITVTPNPGYAPVFGGTCPAGSYVGTTYTTGAVNSDCTVEVSFTNTGTLYTATPNSPLNGSVIGGPKTVTPNGSATWKVVPNSGFTPNLTPGGTCSLGAWNADHTEYTVAPINANCSVNFAFVAAYTVTGSVSGTSPGPGSITSGSSQAVVSGGSAVFTLSRPGTVDMVGSTCTGGSFDVAGTTYTVPNVTANCGMVFSFAALPPATGAHSIPTLSEWGLIILSGLMGLFVVGIRRRQML